MGSYSNLANWRNRVKKKLIDYKGGKCQLCGYDKTEYLSAFVFHHRSPEDKEFGIGSNGRSFEQNKKEADKCDLLCCRCHAELHYGLIPESEIQDLYKERWKEIWATREKANPLP